MSSEYNIRVRIKPEGGASAGREVEDSLAKIEARAERLGRMIQVALGGAAAKHIIELADKFARMEAQLATLSPSLDQAHRNMDRLFETSQKTGTAVADSVREFQLLKNATQDLGVADERLIALLGKIQENIEANGRSAADAAAFIERLSAGIEGGRLRFEALRSLLIQMPQLLDALKARFGTTTNGIMVMAAEGKITGGVVYNALEQMKESHGPETVENAVGRLRNSFDRLIAVIDRLTGARSRVAAFFDALAEGSDKAAHALDTYKAPRGYAQEELEKRYGAFSAFMQRLYESKEFRELVQAYKLAREAEALMHNMQAPYSTAPVSEKVTDPQALARYNELLRKTNEELDREHQLLGLGNEDRELRTKLLAIEERFKANRGGPRLSADQLGDIEAQLRQLQALKKAMGVIEDAAKTVFKGMEDSIISFVQTGKFEFKKFADSVIADLIRIALQAFVTKPLVNAVTGAFGSAFGSSGGLDPFSGGLPGFATGGSFTVGGSGGTNSQLVAFRATPGERVDVSHSQNQGSGHVTNVYNYAENSKVSTKERKGPGGQRITDVIIQTVEKALADGTLDGTMGARFGARQIIRRR